MKIKVLFVVPDFYPNSTGFANSTTNMVNSILLYGKDKYEVYVYTQSPLNGRKEIEGANVTRVFGKKKLENRFTLPFFDRKRYNIMRNIVLKNTIDIIFFETNTFPRIQNWALKEFGKKVFVRIHSTADTEVPVFYNVGSHSRLEKNDRKLIYQFMQGVCNIASTSNFYLNFVKHHFLKDNVYSIWNNKSYSLLFNTAGIDSFELTVTNNNRFLSMGKMSDNGLTQKGMLDLIKAIYYVRKREKLPNDFELTIIGDGVKRDVIDKLIHKLNLEDNIKILKYASHDEVFDLMKSSKAIILLSRYEGQSMFITESIALGKPLIVTDNNGMQDMIKDGINGFVVKTGDYYDAADKIEKMINLDKEAITSFSEQSLKIYNENYTGMAVFQQFDEIVTFSK